MKIIEMLQDHDQRQDGTWKYPRNTRQVVGPKLAGELTESGKAYIVGDAPGNEVEPLVSSVAQPGDGQPTELPTSSVPTDEAIIGISNRKKKE